MFKTIIICIGIFFLVVGALFVFESMRKVSRIRNLIRRSDIFRNICESRMVYPEVEEIKLNELLYNWGLTIIMLGVILNFIANRL